MAKKINKETATKILSEIQELYQDSLDSLNSRRDEILENYAFYSNIQYAVRNNEFVIDQETGEAAELNNILLPIVRAATAATLSNQINISIPATNGDQRSRAKAEASEELCRAFQHNGTVDYDELYSTVLWSKIAGLGWMKVYWDPEGGQCLQYGEDDGFDKVEEDDFGEPIVNQVFEGDICTEFVSCIDGIHDPTVSSPAGLKKAGAYFFHRKLRPMRELEDRFPTDFFGKDTHGRWSVGRRTHEQIAFGDIAGTTDSVNTTGTADQNVLCEIVEFWQMPTKRYPNGRLIIFSDSLILYMGANILRPCRLPFLPLKGDNPMPGSLWSQGVVSALKSNQRSLNRTKSKIREIVDKVINARIWTPLGSGVDPNTFGDMPGQVVEYVKGFKPETDQSPEIPGSLFNYVASLQDETKYASGYGDVAQGLDTPNITSGRQYAFAHEAASSIREPDMKSYRVFLINVLQHCLLLARQFYDDGRMIRILGEDGRWVLKEFRSDSYDINNDIVIELDSQVPDSKAQRFSETVELFGAGMFNPDDPSAKNALKILGGQYYRSNTFDPDIVHRDRARRQILQVMQDPMLQQIEVYPWDNHTVWLDEINKWRATVEYEDLDPQQKEIVNDAAEVHEQYLADQNQVLGQDMAAMQGQGPSGAPPGPAPQPPGQESPLDGGYEMNPEAAPTMSQFVADESSDAGGNAIQQGNGEIPV